MSSKPNQQFDLYFIVSYSGMYGEKRDIILFIIICTHCVLIVCYAHNILNDNSDFFWRIIIIAVLAYLKKTGKKYWKVGNFVEIILIRDKE
jgi:hypothetical protein